MNHSDPPTLLVVAGPNGSGKTTLTNRLRAMGFDFGEYVNAAEIALSLQAGPSRDKIAQEMATDRRLACLARRQSFSFETVMSHPSKLDEMMSARQAGYVITFIGVALQSPLLNVQRVALRVSEGGHDVPHDKIVARYDRVLELMPHAIAIADRSLIFDNSDSEAGPRLCLTARQKSTTPRQVLDIRLDPAAACHPEHWVMRHLVSGLERLQADDAVALNFSMLQR